MFWIIIILVTLFFAIFTAATVALYHFLGLKGLLALPFIIVALLWMAKKALMAYFTGVKFGAVESLAEALKGATATIHSVTPVPKPPEFDDEGESDTTQSPKHFYAVEMTINPQRELPEGVWNFWHPSQLVLTDEPVRKAEKLEGNKLGSAVKTEAWNGTAFGPEEEDGYTGERRVRVTFAIAAGARTPWMQYFNEPICQLSLPKWRSAVDSLETRIDSR